MRLSYFRQLDEMSAGWAMALTLILGLAGCNSGTQRTQTAGTGAEAVVGSSGDAAPANKVPHSTGDSESGSGNGEGEGSGSNGSGGGTQLTGKSLEQCTAEKKAWRAVVNSGKSPSECTESLVSWCCTRNEVLARFPTASAKLDAEFARYIDGEKHVLYHCSFDGVNRTTFHMAKVEGARVFYRTLYIEKAFPVETGNSGSCPVVTSKDLAATAGSADDTADNATANSTDDASTATEGTEADD